MAKAKTKVKTKKAGKAGVQGAVKKGGGRPLTDQAGAEKAADARTERSHLPTHDAGARKAIVAIAQALKGLTGLDSTESELVASAVKEASAL